MHSEQGNKHFPRTVKDGNVTYFFWKTSRIALQCKVYFFRYIIYFTLYNNDLIHFAALNIRLGTYRKTDSKSQSEPCHSEMNSLETKVHEAKD